MVYGLVLAITAALTGTAVNTVIAADSAHAHRPPPVVAGHKPNSVRPAYKHPSAPGGGRALFIATTQQLPRVLPGAHTTSPVAPPSWQPPQSGPHGLDERAHKADHGKHKGWR